MSARDCNACPLYQAAEKFALTSCRRSPEREYQTEVGKLIAAGAAAKSVKLADLSEQIGYGDDYIARICRGKLVLSRRAALLIGPALGLDLIPYVIGGPGRPQPASAAESLPFAPGPCAADLARSAS